MPANNHWNRDVYRRPSGSPVRNESAGVRPASSPGPSLEYQTPAVSRVDLVMRELAGSEKLGGAVVAGKLAIGVPLCLIGPAVVTSILFWFERQWGLHTLPDGTATFGLVSLAVVPLMFWLDHRTRGRFMSEAVEGETNPYRASSYGEYEFGTTKLAWMAYVELALTGPRLVREAIDYVRGRPVGSPATRAAAARLVVDLLAAGEGRNLRSLVRPARPPAEVERSVAYLLARDWVGVSSRRDRVWLLSATRDRLAARLSAS
jgi:hypothetical protein